MRSLQGRLTTALPLMWLRSIESREHSYARKLARRLPALYLATLRHSHQFRRKVSPPTRPPLAPVRSRPFAFARVVPGRTARCPPPLPPLRACPDTPLALARDVPGQTARCPPPRPRGAWKTKTKTNEKKYLPSSSARGAGAPYPPALPPSLLGSRSFRH